MSKKKAQAEYISKKIKELRAIAEWSQSELARRAGITSAAISLLEKGDRVPSLVVTHKLADAFKVTVRELTGDNSSRADEMNTEAQAFFRDHGDILKLSNGDQLLIKGIVQSMKEKDRDPSGD